MDLRTPVTSLPTVRGAAAKGLQRLGLRTVRDLLFHFPRRHEDRRHLTALSDVRPKTSVVVRGILADVSTKQAFRRYRKGVRPVVVTNARLTDGATSVPVRWLHQRFIEKTYPSGTEVYLAGTVSEEGALVAPDVERVRADHAPIHLCRLVPIYPETAGVTSRMLRYLIARVLPLAASLAEYLPATTRESEGLLDFPTAVGTFHLPPDETMLERARERLAFDELFLLQLSALVRRMARRAETAPELPVSEKAITEAMRALPFTLTPSQETAVRDILHDLRASIPMARLLAGDVGSGKTVVAGLAALAVSRAGGQTALLAPTEILTEQHTATLTELLGNAGLRVGLLTASTVPKARKELLARLKSGALDVLVGTHALLETPHVFRNLVLVIVDEQHRFGVRQRGELTRHGSSGTTPHFLSLSATPIPRTLQLTAYGDVDVSLLDPRPGQLPVRTEIVTPSRRNVMYATLQNRITSGGQVFVVCPRVEEIPGDERRSVEREYVRLRRDLFPNTRLAALHGKMRAAEKTRVIESFRQHAIDLLVTSTVVEVGVDIPDADTLLVEEAERFGLATLHQLRGRVGRRGQQAQCFLATESDDPDACARLETLVRSTNGLEIAEEDLRRRGPGEIVGTRQHGGVTCKVANLADLPFLLRVRAAAEKFLAADFSMANAPTLAARVRQLNVTTHFE